MDNGKTRDEAIKELNKGDGGKDKSGVSKQKKMTPAEKIASVHIDFSKDNILPELNESTLKQIREETGINVPNKKVLAKGETVYRNKSIHGEVPTDEYDRLISETLYSPDKVINSNNKNKPYVNLVKFVMKSTETGKELHGITVIDLDDNKENFELVHWMFVGTRGIKKTEKAAIPHKNK